MKRVGARGEGKWERITLGPGVDEIAAKLLELRDEYGADSVALWNLPASVPPTFGLHNLMTARFRNAWGGVDPVYQYGIDDGPVYAIDYMFGMGSPAISRLAASSAGPNGARTSPNGPSTHPNASSRSRVLHPKCSSSSRTSTATATASPASSVHFDDDDWRIVVRTPGSGEGIDKPAGAWGDLHMEWMPVWATKCMRCSANDCTESYPEPFCVHSCPTRALSFGDVEDESTPAGTRAAELKKAGRRFFKMSEFEQTRPGITYVNRKR